MPLQRFHDLADAERLTVARDGGVRPLNLLLLADDRHVANVVQDHIGAFALHSRHYVQVVNPIHANVAPGLIDPLPDAILIHYSIFILGDYYLPAPWREFVRAFPGAKAQIIQDEYRHINAMRARMAELGIGAVFSSLEVGNLPKVYEGEALQGTHFYSCLPGYIADTFKTFAPPPIADRPLDVVYRGRELPFHNGRGVREKIDIGDQMIAIAAEHGLNVDLTSKEVARIYGRSWNDFLMSGRTTLGVEGGVSIFDFDDALDAASKAYVEAHPGAGFEEVWHAVLATYEGNIVHRTITPKHLEAIATKTAMVLYPGRYRGILEPHRHYIPLERDLSNAAEVVRLIRDTAYLQDLVDRTYAELIDRDDLSTRFYVRQVDTVLSQVSARQDATFELLELGRRAALETALAQQAAVDQAVRRAEAERAEAQARIEAEHAEFVRRQQEVMRLAAEEGAREQARIEREHAEFVRGQLEEMRLAAGAAAREQARIEAEHAEFVRGQQEEMRLAGEAAAREQARIEREHAEFVRRQQEEMQQAAQQVASKAAE